MYSSEGEVKDYPMKIKLTNFNENDTLRMGFNGNDFVWYINGKTIAKIGMEDYDSNSLYFAISMNANDQKYEFHIS